MTGGRNKYTERQEMTEVKVSGGDGGVGGEADWKTQRCRRLLLRGLLQNQSLGCDCAANGA